MATQYNTWNQLVCAGCIGAKLYDQGEESDLDFTLSLDTRITLTMPGVEDIIIAERKREKTTVYHRKFWHSHGTIDEITSEFSSGFGGDCGDSEWSTNGSYSFSQSSLDTEIRFADLRNGTIFYRSDISSASASGDNDHEIGHILAYGGWQGGEGACQDRTIYDAVGFTFDIASSGSGKEQLEIPIPTKSTKVSVYQYVASGVKQSIGAAASDRMGLCSPGLLFMCPAWGTYSVIDETEPYNCKTGDYTEKYSVENLEDYFTSWERQGPRYRFLDDKDAELFAAYFKTNTTKVIDYVNPLVVTIAPFGSVAFDGRGDIFYSLSAADDKKHNKIIMADNGGHTPEIIMGTDTFRPITFYPVAPV
jgi:hypothetical protein